MSYLTKMHCRESYMDPMGSIFLCPIDMPAEGDYREMDNQLLKAAIRRDEYKGLSPALQIHVADYLIEERNRWDRAKLRDMGSNVISLMDHRMKQEGVMTVDCSDNTIDEELEGLLLQETR